MLIVFKTDNYGFHVKIKENSAAQEVVSHLPLDGVVSKWGEEIYFETNAPMPMEGQTMDVNVGDVAYWPLGKCVCVFYGRTPASITDKPVPSSPVVVIGHTLANPDELREIKAGEHIRFFVMGRALGDLKEEKVYDDNRKLSQDEIDILVKRLIAEKQSRAN
jgi:uncharacterized protein